MKNSIKIILTAFTFILFSVLYSANAAAVATSGEWIANEGTSISINNGQNAELYAYVFSMNPPMNVDISMFDQYGNKIATLFNSQINDYSTEQTITVTQAIYGSAGTYDVIIQASDAKGGSSYAPLTLQVNAAPGPGSITFTSSPSTTARKYQTYSYDVDATGGSGTLTYSLTTAPSGMTINAATGLVSWTPTQLQIGNFNVIITATDGSASATQSFIINIPNSAPVLRDISDKSVIKGNTLEITASATDSDNDPITYSIDSSDFEQDGSTFTWDTDSDTDTDTYTVTITASDGLLTDSSTFDVEVEKANHEIIIKSLSISKEEFYPGEILSVELEIENNGNIDEENIYAYATISSLGTSASTSQFDLDKDDSTKKTLQLAIQSGAAKGTYTLTVTCEDDTVYKSFTVKEKVTAPEISITAAEELVEKKIGTESIILIAVLVVLIICTIIYINKIKKQKQDYFNYQKV